MRLARKTRYLTIQVAQPIVKNVKHSTNYTDFTKNIYNRTVGNQQRTNSNKQRFIFVFSRELFTILMSGQLTAYTLDAVFFLSACWIGVGDSCEWRSTNRFCFQYAAAQSRDDPMWWLPIPRDLLRVKMSSHNVTNGGQIKWIIGYLKIINVVRNLIS